MLEEFARLTQSLFPGIRPGDVQSCFDAIRQYGPVARDFYAGILPPKVCQGDILRTLRFLVTEQDGEVYERLTPGMVLSNSCDFDNDDKILMAQCAPFDSYRRHRSVGHIRNNTFFSLLYLPGVPRIGDTVVDLSQVQVVRTSHLRQSLHDGTIERVSSLSPIIGYYFFIAKLTVHLLRPQQPDEVRNEAGGPNQVERLGEWLQRTGRTLRYR